MKYRQGTSVATGTTEGTIDFYVRERYLTSVQVQDEHTYPMYVRVLYYQDLADEFPEVLFANWLRATTTYYNCHTLVFNKPVDEKGIVRVTFLNESGATITPQVTCYYSETPTTQTGYYDPSIHQSYWAYNQMIERHTSAGAIEVDYQPAAGSWFEIETVKLTAGMTAAEDFTITIQDGAGLILKTLSVINTQTGTWEIPIIATHDEDTASTASTIGKNKDTIRIQYPMTLNITSSSCTATDDITILMLCKLKDKIPTITFTGNTQNQAGYASAYSKVI